MTRKTTLAVGLLALLVTSCAENPQKAKLKYVESGDKLVEKKNFSEAIIQYRNAVTKDGSFGEARFKLASAYEATGDLRNALREYVRAADLMPKNIEAQLRAGKLLATFGQYPEAKARALAVLEADPKNVNALVILGNSLAGLKDVDGAITQLQDAIDSDPKVTFSYANLGLLEMRKGDSKAALSAFQRAVELQP